MTALKAKLARLAPPAAAPPPAASREHLVVTDRIHGPGYRQGRIEIGAARAAQAATVASLALDDALADVDASRLLLVDTETTGLHGGAGTLPFIVGLAWFEGDSLIVRQLFLAAPGHERPLLGQLAERLAAASLMVTFNGKCFDWPLLRTRLVMNRVPAPAPLPHLDLLHCARRVFKRRLGATRLQDLEREVLGFHRVGDIDGAMIPAVYFDWLRSGRTGAIKRVLEHNAHDLISMAAVMAELCRRFEQVAEDDPAEDCLSLARLAERLGHPERAQHFAEAAADRTTAPGVLFDSLGLQAKLAARRKDFEAAAALLEQATRVPCAAAPLAHLAFARVCEHGLKDLPRALHHARLASGAEDQEANARRVARLIRRLARSPKPEAQTRD